MPFTLDQKWIEQAEEKLNRKLPEVYKEEIQEENGGEADVYEDIWELYPICDNSDKKRFSRTWNDIIKQTEDLSDWEGFPETAVAIASNGCGDQLILLPNESEPNYFKDTIYFWSHETEEIIEVAKHIKEIKV